jgi:hypothetical protein
MISEEHIQLESSSGPGSSKGFHDAQHVQTALEPPPVSEPMTSSHTAEVLARTHEPERDLSATVEEVELTTVLDRTLVEEADASTTKKHSKVPSGSSISFPAKGHVSKKSRDSHSTRLEGSVEVEGGSPTSWHPLHSKDGETQGYDHNTVLVEDDITDSNGKLLYPQTPPLENNLKSTEGYYSPSTQQKFHTMPKARWFLFCFFVFADDQYF